MVPHSTSRRRLLRATVGVAAVGVAGCNESVTGGGPETPSPTETVQPTLDYDAVIVRNPAAEPFVGYDPADSLEDETDEPLQRTLVTADEADRVSFRTEVAGVEEARALLRETDFERSVVHVSEHRVGACRTLEVDYVTVDGDSFDLDFCSPLRPADVACSLDDRDVVAAFVRFPMATDDIGSYTLGRGGSCERPRRPEGSS
ncbi:hypothetical protein C2R22_05350 [Salinigranum rubrum]|uniref:Uncharacterized protein n=2 Tax=Salinigranum rubrum TaxID=755307 RepID=A0A2I8VGY8_9EURY|nr:hypothetical protein C2R22_05350 [Salinigranum rubrum]